MASLMEELITTLGREKEVYAALLPMAEQKTQAIIDNDLERLQQITEQEQDAIAKIHALERKREETVSNIGVVLNRKPEELSLSALAEMMERQPQEQAKLKQLHAELSGLLHELNERNGRNRNLIEESLDMISYNMNLIQSSRNVSGNNYTKNAGQWDMSAFQTGMFDAKQ